MQYRFKGSPWQKHATSVDGVRFVKGEVVDLSRTPWVVSLVRNKPFFEKVSEADVLAGTTSLLDQNVSRETRKAELARKQGRLKSA